MKLKSLKRLIIKLRFIKEKFLIKIIINHISKSKESRKFIIIFFLLNSPSINKHL